MDQYRIASKGKFRVVTADGMGTFTWVEGEFGTEQIGKDHIDDRCKIGSFYKTWLYDDSGNCLYERQP